MVQLKAPFVATALVAVDLFQFLDGAIKSGIGGFDLAAEWAFQFLDGAIKSGIGGFDLAAEWAFQFLDGAIKSSTSPGSI